LPRPFVLPGQPTTFARSHPYKISRTRLEVELDFGTKSISGKVTHTVQPSGSKISSLEFDAAELNIKSVKVNAKAVQFTTKQSSIDVNLGSDLLPQSSANVEIEYSGTPRAGLYFRGPTKEFPNRRLHAFTQGESELSRYWFPCYDYPNMRMATEGLFTVPQNMTVISNGKLVSVSEPNKGKRTWHYQQEIPHPTYLFSVVAGEFQKIEETNDGILLQYVIPPGKEEEAKRSFEKTPKMLDFFASVTGQKYPYPKYAQCTVSDFMYGGMENITATTLTERTLHDARSHLDFTSDTLVAHELAHQWFGDLLTCKDWSHAWLNEGFASYFDALFRERDMGYDEFLYYMYSPFKDYLISELERYQRPIVTKKYWDPEELFDYHTYQKGAWVLHGLRGFLGDEVFFAGIKNYVTRQKNSNVETSDFRKPLEQASGLDLESFFKEWLYSPGFPEYDVTYSWNSDSKMVELKAEQTNAESDGVPVFTNPIEIRFSLKGGATVVRRIRMQRKTETFFFSMVDRPLNVNFDPKHWILKNLKFHKPKEMHIYQLNNDDNSMERYYACNELANFPTDDVVAALGEAIDSDGFWGVQAEAAKALGKIATKKAFEVLLSKVSHKNHKTRRGIAYGLRGFTDLEGHDPAIDALIKILENDEAYYARGYAAWSLGFYKKSEKAFEAMKRALAQDSIIDIVRYRLFQGFAERGDTRAVPLAIDYLLHGKEFQGRMLAARAVGKLGKGDEKAKEALLSIQHDQDTFVREDAALAVADLQDSSSVPALEEWLASEMDGRVRRRLRESIHVLKERVLETEKIAKLNADIEKLSRDAKKAEDKIAALEAIVNKGTQE
jgi:aminopeptidase N